MNDQVCRLSLSCQVVECLELKPYRSIFQAYFFKNHILGLFLALGILRGHRAGKRAAKGHNRTAQQGTLREHRAGDELMPGVRVAMRKGWGTWANLATFTIFGTFWPEIRFLTSANLDLADLGIRILASKATFGCSFHNLFTWLRGRARLSGMRVDAARLGVIPTTIAAWMPLPKMRVDAVRFRAAGE